MSTYVVWFAICMLVIWLAFIGNAIANIQRKLDEQECSRQRRHNELVAALRSRSRL